MLRGLCKVSAGSVWDHGLEAWESGFDALDLTVTNSGVLEEPEIDPFISCSTIEKRRKFRKKEEKNVKKADSCFAGWNFPPLGLRGCNKNGPNLEQNDRHESETANKRRLKPEHLTLVSGRPSRDLE